MLEAVLWSCHMTPEAAANISDPPPLADISREEILRRLNDPTLTVVDVLPVESYEAAHIPRSINLPVADIGQQASVLLPDPAAEIAVYCAKFT
jgi:rhodanese-related sulfurtransferase